MRRSTYLQRSLALCMVVGLLLAACGTLGSAAGGAGDDTIVFGATISITGQKAEEGKNTRDGYFMYLNTINSQGGFVVGDRRYKVRLIYYDDASDPERVRSLYEKLITQDRVNFLLGPYSSQLTAVAVPVAEQYRIPMVAAHGAAESIYSQDNRYTFSVVSPARSYLRGVIAVLLAKDPSVRTVALLGADEPFSREVLAGATEYAEEKGLMVVAQLFYPNNPSDVSDLLDTIKQKRPDLLLAAGHLQDAILIVQQVRALGLTPKAIGFTAGPSTPEFRANLQEAADYIFGATQWTSALKYTGDGPWATPRDYAAAFQARYPDYNEVPYQTAESTAALLAYQRAIEHAGSLDHEAVRAALANLDLMTFYGRIKFDARGVNIYKPMAVEQLHPDGKKYTVFPSDVAEREALYPMPPWTQR
jgi:branched-chain amino acid transport system substrate-binding protein